ncbi:MAG: 50S ribosomal protein L5, large subunit ribosomal protein L5 [Candidatus Gottesmanbacteria bacterium GW2011_GWA2_43_14]|uniref:Large ribosomal subunit protein uL5 n=1 Tax=Candidatus Gottesmanbacteria bacterium GW2011_GWA2_43_14 TaxID=1618443 RepID=A0A0G1GAP0_9BACT|nr:MAG: 50S ribosomal protein L5, large subunit ribosomal protein L5 [Candidatus Gottesmanbacteria bacterium GW2011_GWA2_43_14]
MSQYYTDYLKEGRQKLAKELKIANIMAVPRLKKVVINVSLGEALANKKAVETTMEHIGLITGQKPVPTRARKDISTFKLRKGEIVGIKVTLRAGKMYDFVEKLVKIVLPRIRDFRGIPLSGFDSRGNYTLGLSEQIVFPEIDASKIDKVRGLEVTLVTDSSEKESKKLMEYLGFPFVKIKQ